MKIVDMLDKFISYTVIAEKFGIGKSKVGDIKKNREKFLKVKSEMVTMGMKKKAKVRLAYDKQLD